MYFKKQNQSSRQISNVKIDEFGIPFFELQILNFQRLLQTFYQSRTIPSMPKVYFRTTDSKAFSKDIDSQVNYDKALESITKAFKLPKQNIRLAYSGEIKTGNFILNEDIPHHIIHIFDKSKIANDQITVSLTMNIGAESTKIGNRKTKLNTQVKDLLGNVLGESGIKKEKIKSADLFYRGQKLNPSDTLLDKGVANEDDLNILLNIEYPDPADILTLATLLYQRVDPACLIVRAKPEYVSYLMQFRKARQLNFFHTLQQRYERKRKQLLFSEYAAYELSLEAGCELPFVPVEDEPIEEPTNAHVE